MEQLLGAPKSSPFRRPSGNVEFDLSFTLHSADDKIVKLTFNLAALIFFSVFLINTFAEMHVMLGN